MLYYHLSSFIFLLIRSIKVIKHKANPITESSLHERYISLDVYDFQLISVSGIETSFSTY